ncbi:MAG: hypothetical protein NVS3B14_01010 [Ktedonobacteraceae bacterium]
MNLTLHLFYHTSPLFIYMIVAIALLLESCGIPIVNSTLLLLTGALASLGHLNIFALALVSILGSTTGACLAYVIGLRGGGQLLYRAASRLHIEKQKIQSVEDWFNRSGARMIFFSRIIPYIRPFSCFPAGMARMTFRRFFVAAFSGSVIWCIGVLACGWILGPRWRVAFYLMRSYTIPAVLVIILAVVVYILVKLAISRRLHARLHTATGSALDDEYVESQNLLEEDHGPGCRQGTSLHAIGGKTTEM